MQRKDIKVRSTDGREFDCYMATPDGEGKVPAMVLASAIHGVDEDIRDLADAFAAQGFLAAAPDLFWRSVPGPLKRNDPRSKPRGQPRLEKLKDNEKDLADTLAMLKADPRFNGKAAVMGFCYGGPFAVLGPKRLGYAAGISCHGTQMLDFVQELQGVTQPVCIIWGDQDVMAPPPVLEAYRNLNMKNVAVHIFPGVQHGYMMKGAPDVYDQRLYDFSMGKAFEILAGLR